SHAQADGGFDINTGALVQEAKDAAKEQFPHNANLPNVVGRLVEQRVNQVRWEGANDKREATTALDDIIAKNPGIVDTQSLLAVNGADKIVQRLSAYDKSTLDQRIYTLRKKEFSEEWNVNKQRYEGLKNNDVQKFLETDFGLINLEPGERAHL